MSSERQRSLLDCLALHAAQTPDKVAIRVLGDVGVEARGSSARERGVVEARGSSARERTVVEARGSSARERTLLVREQITYAELLSSVRRHAALLLAHARPGQRALLLYPTGLPYVAAFLGCFWTFGRRCCRIDSGGKCALHPASPP